MECSALSRFEAQPRRNKKRGNVTAPSGTTCSAVFTQNSAALGLTVYVATDWYKITDKGCSSKELLSMDLYMHA